MGDVPTRNYLPIVYYQCRDRQGLKSPAISSSIAPIFNICGQSADALLIADIRQRFSH